MIVTDAQGTQWSIAWDPPPHDRGRYHHRIAAEAVGWSVDELRAGSASWVWSCCKLAYLFQQLDRRPSQLDPARCLDDLLGNAALLDAMAAHPPQQLTEVQPDLFGEVA